MSRTEKKTLVELRKERGISQKNLAQIIGCTASAVSQWEKGKRMPSYKTISRLALFYNVSIDNIQFAGK